MPRRPAQELTITPTRNGPYALCRCGRSRNKPFCDGAHWDVEFRDPRN